MSHVQDICSEELQQVVHSGHLRATQDFGVLAEVDSVSICVPTPLSKTKDPDISYIVSVTDEIRERLHPGQLIVLRVRRIQARRMRSFCHGLPLLACKLVAILSRLFARAYRSGQYGISSGQYAQDSGRGDTAVHASSDAPLSANHRQRGAREFQPCRRNGQTAGKYVSSRQYWPRKRSGPDVCTPRPRCGEVIDAAATKPFGFMPFYPGPGLGGHCIPLDPHYLAWKLKTLDYRARFIELADDINTNMPHWVVTRVADVLNNVHKSVKGSKILVLGVAYKADTNDLESPALDVLRLLQAKGVRYASTTPSLRRWTFPDSMRRN